MKLGDQSRFGLPNKIKPPEGGFSISRSLSEFSQSRCKQS